MLFPEIEPYRTHLLNVGAGHQLYVEESGHPQGLPIVVLHGGPGSECSPKHRQRFNPKIYRIICFDQRGCGRSQAAHPLHANTTAHLVQDVATIQQHLGLTQWAVYGTSWGSTLALAYAQAHPQAVLGLIIGGVFLASPEELAYFTAPTGLPLHRPQQFTALQNLFPHHQGHALMQAVYQAAIGSNLALAHQAALAFARYEGSAMEPDPNLIELEEHLATPAAFGSAQIELHYFANHCFLTPHQLMHHLPRVTHLPCHILQGEIDLVTPPNTAQAVHAAWPGSTLQLVPHCGHRGTSAMEAARVAAADALAQQLGA
jgi:proline iminopeptidase